MKLQIPRSNHLMLLLATCLASLSGCDGDTSSKSIAAAAKAVDASVVVTGEMREAYYKIKSQIRHMQLHYAPTSRVTGIKGNSFPAGVLVSEPEPLLATMGFQDGDIITAINGVSTPEIFSENWRATGDYKSEVAAAPEHYMSLANYLIDQKNRKADGTLVMTVHQRIPETNPYEYTQRAVSWRLTF